MKETKPTEVLVREHEAIKVMLSILGKIADRLEAGTAVEAEHLQKAVEFITGFADRCHHAKEEDLLFPALEKAGIPRQGGPVGVMLLEHEQGRAHVRAMKEAAARYAGGDKRAGHDYARHARAYAALLTDHIFKEDQILYAMAEARLTAEQKAELDEEFDRVENEIVGAGKHEYFEKIVAELERTYLK